MIKITCERYPEETSKAKILFPGIGGSILAAWIEGYLGIPQRGVRRYPKTSACQEFYIKGKSYRRTERVEANRQG